MAKMTSAQLRECFKNNIAVSLRKGVDGFGSARLYNALNPLFFNGDKAMCAAANEYVTELAKSAIMAVDDYCKSNNITYAEAISGNSHEELRRAMGREMQAAACIHRPAKRVRKSMTITTEVQGMRCLQKTVPFTYSGHFGKPYNVEAKKDWDDRIGEKIEGDESDRAFRPWHHEKIEGAQVMLLHLCEQFPEVKAFYQDCFADPVPAARQELYDASMECEPECWYYLASSLLYYAQ